MDINCGVIIDDEKTIREMGDVIFEELLRVVSGKKTKSEELGVGAGHSFWRRKAHIKLIFAGLSGIINVKPTQKENNSMANEYIRFTDDEECPYSDVVVVDGDLLFLSGLVSEDLETGDLVPGDITAETRQTLNNLETILKRCGSDMSHVIRLEVLLHDFSERNEMNAEYAKHFPANAMPARLCYGGVDLAAGCKIEIMAIARKVEA